MLLKKLRDRYESVSSSAIQVPGETGEDIPVEEGFKHLTNASSKFSLLTN